MSTPDAYDAWWDAVAFLRTWKGPFTAAVDGLKKAEAEAGELRKAAEKALGGPLPAGVVAEGAGDPAATLAALRARVADAERWAEVAAQRAVVEEWLGRATPDGPLAEWAADARARLAEVDPKIAAATTGGLGAAKEQLDVLVRGVEALRRGLLDRADQNRLAGDAALEASEEAAKLVRGDLRSMSAGLTGLQRAREDDVRRGLLALVALALAGGVTGMGLAYVQGAGPGLPVGAIGLGTIGGLGVALAIIVTRYVQRTRKMRGLVEEARTLKADAAQAQAELKAEVLGLQEAADRLARDAKALRATVKVPDHGPLLDAVMASADAAAVDAFLLRAEEESRPDVAALGVMAGVTALMLGLGYAVSQAPAPDATPLPYAGAPAGPAAGVVVSTTPDASPEAGATAPEGGTPPAASTAPPTSPTTTTTTPTATSSAAPSAAAGPFVSGPWEGTLGTSRLTGTLTASGSSVRGSLTLSAPEGDQACAVKGTLSGEKLTLSGSGCPAKFTLTGSVRDEGRTASGTARSTVTFQGRTQVASDTWQLRAP